MNNTFKLINELTNLDIKLSLQEGKLRIDAPRGIITPDLEQRIRTQKNELIAFLNNGNSNLQIGSIEKQSNAASPLNEKQLQIWQHQINNPQSRAYNLCRALQINSKLNTDYLYKAWQQLIFCHDILRSNLVHIEGNAHLQLNPSNEQSFFIEDQSDVSADELANIAESFAEEEIQRAFILERNALARLRVICYSENSYLLLVSVHGLICDEYSLTLLLKQLSELYISTVQQKATAKNSAEKIQFHDFNIWHQQWANSPDADNHFAYWKQQIQETPPRPIALNAMRSATQYTTAHQLKPASSCHFEIDKNTRQALANFAQKNNLNLDTLLLSAYQILLARYCAQQRFYINMSHCGRLHPHAVDMIGPLERTLLLPCLVDNSESLIAFLQRVETSCNIINQHVGASPEYMRHLRDEHKYHISNPEASFRYISLKEQIDDMLMQLSRSSVSLINFNPSHLKADCNLIITETREGSLSCSITYNHTILHQALITAAADNFLIILKSMLEKENCALKYLDILSEKEKLRQIHSWNQTQANLSNKCIGSLFEQQAQLTPHAIAVQCEQQRISYQELNQRANTLAAYLMHSSFKSQQHIGIFLNPGIDTIIALLAIIKMGAAYVPLDPRLTIDELYTVTRALNLKAILTHSSLLDMIPDALARLDIDALEFSPFKDLSISANNNIESPLYYIYTPQPESRAIGISHASQINLATWYAHTINLSTRDNLLIATDFATNLTQKNIFSGLISGATLIISETLLGTQTSLVEEIEHYKISAIDYSPRAFYALLAKKENWDNLNKLRWITLSGDLLYVHPLKEWLGQLNPETCVMFAHEIIEAGGTCNFFLINDNNIHKKFFPFGAPIQNMQTYVLDEALNPVPLYMQGEIYIGGEGLSLGYLTPPQLNKSLFVENTFGKGVLFRTHLLGARAHNGNIFYLGCSEKDQPHLSGQIRQALTVLEAAILEQQDVSQIAVVASQNSQKLLAYICQTEDSNFNINQIQLHLLEQFEPRVLPNEYHIIDSIPLRSDGSVDTVLLNSMPTNVELKDPTSQSMTTTEKIVAVIWSEILSVKHIDLNSHFFVLGGNSLSAQKANAQLQALLHQVLKPTLIFEHPKLNNFATAIDASPRAPIDLLPAVTYPSEFSSTLSAQQTQILYYAQHKLPLIHQRSAFFCLKNNIDIKHIKKCIDTLHIQYPILNNRIDTLNAKQNISSHHTGIFNFKDLSALENTTAREKAKALHLNSYSELFDVDQSLARYALYKISDKEAFLSIELHALICDLFSFSAIIKTFFNIYTNSPVLHETIQPCNIQHFYDHIRKEQQFLNDQRSYNKQLKYWQQQLNEAPKQITIPTDHLRPLKNSAQDKARFEFVIDTALHQKLNAFSHEHGLTLFMSLIAAYHLLLFRHSKQDDICVAVPISKKIDDVENADLGNFSNTLVVRLQPGKNPLVGEYLKFTKRAVLGAMQHQEIDFLTLLKELNILNKTKTLAFCKAAFNFYHNPHQPLHYSKLNTEDIVLQNYSSLEINPDLYLVIVENNETLNAYIEYPTTLFDKQKIATLAIHYIQLLHDMMLDVKQPVKTLKMLDDDEVFALLHLDKSIYASIGRLTNMQRDIYIDSTLDPAQTWNYFGQAISFNTQIDPQILNKAIQATIDIESNLRTHIKPSSVTYSDLAYRCIIQRNHPLTRHTLLMQEHQGDATSLRTLIDSFIYQPYDLANNLNLRNTLVRYNTSNWVWICAFHHVVVDGLGMHLYILKVLEAYEKIAQGSKVEYEQYTYDDYYEYHRYRSDTKETTEYWHNIVKRVDPLSGGRHLANNTQCAQSVERIYSIDAEHSAEIRKYCFKNRSTPAAYTKSIFTILLKSYFNQRHRGLIFNEVRVGRTRENAWTLGCCFTNQPFAVPNNILDKHSSFNHLLNFTTNYPHQVSPYEFISNSQQVRVISGTDIQFSFNFYGAVPPVRLFGIACDITEIIPRLDNAIHVVARMVDKELRIHMLFSTDTWNDYRFLERFDFISRQILQGANKLETIKLILPDEESAQPKLNLAPYRYKSLSAWLNDVAQHYAEQHAVIYQNTVLSYAQLHHRANQLAHYLQELQLGVGSKIALCLPPNIDFMIGLLAIIKAGATYIPIDPNYPQERISYILNDAGVDRLITQEHIATHIQIDATLCIYLDTSDNSFYKIAEQYPTQPPCDNSNLEDILYIIYTSGSTGQPKGAQIKLCGVINLLQWYCKEFEFSDVDRNLIISASGFDLTQKNFFAPLLTGGSVVLADTTNYDHAYIQQLIEHHQISIINCAPSAFYALTDSADTTTDFTALSSLRLVLFGGEPIRINLLLKWLQSTNCNAQLVNMYGPTECTDIAAFYRITEPLEYLNKPIPIGKANSNIRLYVVDPDIRQLPAGIPGELAIGGQSVGAGYLNHGELTQKVFIDNPFAPGKLYLTGDLVKIDGNNDIVFLNRIDLQLKLRGLRIEPGEIEYAIRKLQHINDALVLVRNEQLIAYATLEPNSELDSQWRKQLATSLPPHMLPQHLISLPKWPLTPNGKIDRSALPEPQATQSEYVAPRTELEVRLANIWQDLLNIEKVGIYDNFFEIGGHSLIAVRLAKRIQDELKLELPIAALFNAQDIASLAGALSNSDMLTQGCLLPLKAGNGNPIFLIHPVSGLAVGFQTLTKHLKTDQAVIGIQAFGFDANTEPSTSVEQAAQRYLEAMQQVQEEGPYFIAGYSLGGAIALEIARLLLHQGEKVEWLAMIDAASHFKWLNRTLSSSKALFDFYSMLYPETNLQLTEFEKVPANEQIDWLIQNTAAHVSREPLQRAAQVLHGFKTMMRNYKAKPLKLDAIYISAEARTRSPLMRSMQWLGLQQNTLGWNKIIKGNLRHFVTAGDHDSLMQEPYVEQLAALLDHCINHRHELHQTAHDKQNKE